MTSLDHMRRELRRKYERLLRREKERRKTMLKYYEPIETSPLFQPLKRKFLVKCKHCGDIMELKYAPSHIRDVHGISPKGRETEDDFIILGWKVSRSSNPNDLEFLMRVKGETGLERIMNQVRILAEYGKDPEAEKLMTKFGLAFATMPARDFWTYLYDWTQEAIELLKARKIHRPIYAWARRI